MSSLSKPSLRSPKVLPVFAVVDFVEAIFWAHTMQSIVCLFLQPLVGLLVDLRQASEEVLVKSSVHSVIVCLAKVHLLLTCNVHTCTPVEPLGLVPLYIEGCKTALTIYLPVIYVEQVVVCLVEKDNFRGAVNHRLV